MKTIYILLIFLLIGLATAGMEIGINNNGQPKIAMQTPPFTNTSYYNVSMADFWDALNTPADILHSDLQNLAWSVAGHTFDTNINTNLSGSYGYSLQDAYDSGNVINTTILRNITIILDSINYSSKGVQGINFSCFEIKNNTEGIIWSKCVGSSSGLQGAYDEGNIIKINPDRNLTFDLNVSMDTGYSYFVVRKYVEGYDPENIFKVFSSGQPGGGSGVIISSSEGEIMRIMKYAILSGGWVQSESWYPFTDNSSDLGCVYDPNGPAFQGACTYGDDYAWRNLALRGSIVGSGSPASLSLSASGIIKGTSLYLAENITETPNITMDYSTGNISASGVICDSNGCIGAGDGSYNITYETWAYNQSSPYDEFNYNMSSPYDTYNYNMTVAASVLPNSTTLTIANITNFNYNYNETMVRNGTTLSAANITPGTFGAGNYVFPANLNITGNLTAGTTGLASLKDTYLSLDSNFYLSSSAVGNARILAFDANDYFKYSNATNVLEFYIGGTSEMSLSASTFSVGANSWLPASDVSSFFYIGRFSPTYPWSIMYLDPLADRLIIRDQKSDLLVLLNKSGNAYFRGDITSTGADDTYGQLFLGAEDTYLGVANVFGSSAYQGGSLFLFLAGDYDDVFQYWRIDTAADDLRIFPSSAAFLHYFHNTGDVQLGGDLLVPTMDSGTGNFVDWISATGELVYEACPEVYSISTAGNITNEGGIFKTQFARELEDVEKLALYNPSNLIKIKENRIDEITYIKNVTMNVDGVFYSPVITGKSINPQGYYALDYNESITLTFKADIKENSKAALYITGYYDIKPDLAYGRGKYNLMIRDKIISKISTQQSDIDLLKTRLTTLEARVK